MNADRKESHKVEQEGQPSHTHTLRVLTSLKLHLAVPRVLVEALLLINDDVLDVLHCEVVPEGVEEDVLQLLQRYPLHVKLRHGEGGREKRKNNTKLIPLTDVCV